MTENLFHGDSYLKEFNGCVVSVDENTRAVVLDRTAFYPGGGGQPCDLGTLTIGDRVFTIEKTRKAGGEVEHILTADSGLPNVGDEVTGKLDWERRLPPDAHSYRNAHSMWSSLSRL